MLLISAPQLHSQEALRRQLERYLQAAGSEEGHFALPQLDSVRAMKEVCRLFKGMLLDAREEARRATALADGAVGDSNDTSAATNATDSNNGTAVRGGTLSRGDARGSDKSLLSSTDAVYVGKPESRGGFSLGRAPDNAFPAVMLMATSYGVSSGNTGSGSRSRGPRRSGGGSDYTATTATANSGANGNANGNTSAGVAQNKSATVAMVLSPPQSPEPRRYDDPLLQSLQSDGEGDAVEHNNSNSSSNNWRNANGTTATKQQQQQQQQQFTLGGVSTEARSRLFAQFKSSTTEGCTVCDSIQEARAAARELRTLARSKAGEVNAAKRTIDDLQSALDSKRAAGSSSSNANTALLLATAAAATGECIMDEEEFKLVKLERDAKRTYKAAYDELRSLRQSAEAAQSQVGSLKLELLSLFEDWAAGRVTVESSTNGEAAVLVDSSDYRSPAWEGAAVARTASNTRSTDKLDENELFESMEVERQDPEAVAFFQAQKNAQATRSQNALALRQMHSSPQRMLMQSLHCELCRSTYAKGIAAVAACLHCMAYRKAVLLLLPLGDVCRKESTPLSTPMGITVGH
eukprot:3345-Heterococcus_DN1.PRE.2